MSEFSSPLELHKIGEKSLRGSKVSTQNEYLKVDKLNAANYIFSEKLCFAGASSLAKT